MCLGVTAASFYEIYEWVVDNWFGQNLFIGETDTVTDLADGFLGAGIGGLFLAAMGRDPRYTSRRFRRPMEARAPRVVARQLAVVQRRWTGFESSQSRPSMRASTR